MVEAVGKATLREMNQTCYVNDFVVENELDNLEMEIPYSSQQCSIKLSKIRAVKAAREAADFIDDMRENIRIYGNYTAICHLVCGL